jgi:type IV secretion system protein VirB3
VRRTPRFRLCFAKGPSVDEEREVMARNTLFLAVTRPALFAGIPIEAAVVILLASVITLIGTTNPIYGLVVAAVMFGISRLVVRHDVNAFRLIFLWGRTKAANRNRVFWGGSSYTPLPLKGIKRKGFGRNG